MPAPKCCFDHILPRDLLRPHNTAAGPGGRTRAIAPKGKSWINGSTLRVRFIGGTAAEQATAREQAAWWSAVANLKFDFNNAPDAEIRISFDENDKPHLIFEREEFSLSEAASYFEFTLDVAMRVQRG